MDTLNPANRRGREPWQPSIQRLFRCIQDCESAILWSTRAHNWPQPHSARSRRFAIRIRLIALVASLFVTGSLHAQAAKPKSEDKPKVDPDLLIFVNGEQLTGTLEKADGKNISFKSLMAGEITVPWTNIKELHSNQTFALLEPKQKLTRKDALTAAPEGTVSAENKQLSVKSPTSTATVPLAQVDQLIPSADFTKALAPIRLTQGWAGTASGGVALVRATQDSTTFNGAIALTRALPQVSWLPPSSRTTIAYNQTYGTTSQTGTPTVETNIFHAGAEQDVYFSPRLFALADVAFDHNFSSNLNLQQAYGGGIGFNFLKTPKQQLDLRSDLHYEKQTFFDPTSTANIIGSTFSETYLRNLPRKIVFSEFGSYTPAWNDLSAYSAHINASLGFPVYKGFAFSIAAADDFLNDAPVGTNKNSSQFTTNITYTIKPK
jgi:hypothetical protein